MATTEAVNAAEVNQRTQAFIREAENTLLNLGSTDNQVVDLFRRFLASDLQSPALQDLLNHLMNKRSQRATLLSNLEDRKHQTSSAIINNMK